MTAIVLDRYPETLAMVRLGPGSEVPAWAESSSVFSITATAAETTVLCAARSVPTKARAERGFNAFAVQGARDFTATGTLLPVLAPLDAAEIPVVIHASFDTDWVLVPAEQADAAVEAWKAAGLGVEVAVPATGGA